ncbi:shikimate kinase [Halomarina salina]|uniref:Shikimate kinase n=1 Tax=Halomarina salina TaxID=1872699 RepID=A0ABD5RS23_9EURY|nr:shikimate kinase [Halomarina salina]
MRTGRASAPAAGTVLNALATGTGSAFAIDAHTTATVEFEATPTDHDERRVTGEIADAPDADTRLIERCVELAAEVAGEPIPAGGASVGTESEIPMAAGLKSSSAAANATVLATFDALGVAIEDGPDPTVPTEGTDDEDEATPDSVSRVDACLLGVAAARDVGVTVTGAFDDASASMLGGLTVTDNDEDTVLHRATPDWEVVVWTPPERAFSADADVERCRAVAPMADLVADLALDGQYGRAMTVNGLAFCAALDFPTDPIVSAMTEVTGVSLSGTGPSFVAVGEERGVETVRERWDALDGETWRTTTTTDGGRLG